MSQPVVLVASQPTINRSLSISTGPMSVGMIHVNNNQVRRKNESTERICMFALCLMFIGVPIIVVGLYNIYSLIH